MRIALVCPRFYPYTGGIETHVYEISKRLSKKFEIDVITTDPSGKLPKYDEIFNVKIKRFKSLAPSDSYYFSLDLLKYLNRNSTNYDIIHIHSYHAFPALFGALSKRKNKLVFTPHYHGKGHSFFRNLLHYPYKFIGKNIFKKADAIICVSKFERKLILNNFNVENSKIFLIPNGVNLHEFKLNKIHVNSTKYKDRKIILYVGRIEKYKGIDYVVKALRYLNREFILEIVGKGKYKSKIVKLARKLNLTDRIKFYEDLTKEELIKKYFNADVLVLLSKFEAYGLVIAEALAAGTPCIVPRSSALSEWIDDVQVFGVENPNDYKELAEKICEATSKKSVKRVLPSWDFVAKELKKVYDLIVG